MSTSWVSGDLFSDPVDAYVNPVNCVGVMGAGLALQFKKRFPAYYDSYAEACSRGDLSPGIIHVYPTGQKQPRFILSLPTKRHWKSPSRMEDVKAGLDALKQLIAKHGIRSIAVPALGAGLGGLDWDDVRPRIEAALGDLDNVEVRVYEPLEPGSRRATPLPQPHPNP